MHVVFVACRRGACGGAIVAIITAAHSLGALSSLTIRSTTPPTHDAPRAGPPVSCIDLKPTQEKYEACLSACEKAGADAAAAAGGLPTDTPPCYSDLVRDCECARQRRGEGLPAAAPRRWRVVVCAS